MKAAIEKCFPLLAHGLSEYSKQEAMKRYYFPDESDAKSSEKGTSEDPPNDITKQNTTGEEKDKKEEVNVPEKAVEHYKESAKDTEE